MKDSRILFMGTPDFAVASLKKIVESGGNVVGVVTVPDRPAGRGYKLTPSAVKKYAVEQGLPVYQPEKLRDPNFVDAITELKPDVAVVVAFRMLPKIVWSIPKHGTFNLHGSLLPDYRGAAPINWAVINGEDKTGVTTFFIDEEIDTGAIIKSKSLAIGKNETAGDVHDKLMEVGAELVVETISDIEDGIIQTVGQDDILKGRSPKMAPKIFKPDCAINWQNERTKIHDFIRGMAPFPGAYCTIIDTEGKELMLKVFRTEEASKAVPLGEVVKVENDLLVGTSNGSLKVLELQLAGKKRMRVEDFLRGINVDAWKVKID